jgi:dipeptidyl aminopeptidase/acylaminoacyl peptidase
MFGTEVTLALVLAGALPAAEVDCFGDPLPEGALARMGTVRYRHGGRVESIAFAPDGLTLASTGGPYFCLWDATGKVLHRSPVSSDRSDGIAFAPDGRTLAVADDRVVRLWDPKNWKEVRRLEGHREIVHAVAFSPDGTTLVTASADRTARLWEVRTGVEVRRFEGHARSVRTAAFSPDGKTLATGGDDSLVRLWELATGWERRRFIGHLGSLTSVSFRPDGRAVVTGSEDGTLLLWDVTGLARRGKAERLLATVEHGIPTGEWLRDLRAVEALERAGSPEARRLLKELAGGAEGRLTREARGAVGRLGRRP